MSLKRLPLSVSDFAELQNGNYIYVDKTKQTNKYMNNINRLTNFPSPLVLSDWPKRPILSKDILKKQIILYPFDTFCFAIATQNTQDERVRRDFKITKRIQLSKKHNTYLNSGKQIVLIGISFNYIERAAGTTEGPTFDIEWKTEIKI